jgi:hypothetical protein
VGRAVELIGTTFARGLRGVRPLPPLRDVRVVSLAHTTEYFYGAAGKHIRELNVPFVQRRESQLEKPFCIGLTGSAIATSPLAPQILDNRRHQQFRRLR